MTPARFRELAALYPRLRIAVVGDVCLDRYLEIDPARAEVSIETGLPVYNVVGVRPQPGAAGTVVANLSALGVGEIVPVGWHGDDGEGFELRRALAALPGVRLDHLTVAPARRTFTYTKPLVIEPARPPRELNRLDFKNWTPTPPPLSASIVRAIEALRGSVDAIAVMDQVDVPDTGVVTAAARLALARCAAGRPVIADCRRGLREYPPMLFKMNRAELAAMRPAAAPGLDGALEAVAAIARRNGQPAVVTLGADGLAGAEPGRAARHVPAPRPTGPIDIVGAGDCVTANLAAALAAGATVEEAMEVAAVAASIAIQQLGTTGAATTAHIEARLPFP